jgi:hypothetical protein
MQNKKLQEIMLSQKHNRSLINRENKVGVTNT